MIIALHLNRTCSTTYSIDTENAKVEYVDINGKRAMYVEKSMRKLEIQISCYGKRMIIL